MGKVIESTTKKFNTSVVTFDHPGLTNRKVSVVFVNNKLDHPSFMFLCNEVIHGGRKGTTAGKTSHKGRAYKIAELYDHLHDKGLTWQNAEEEDIREIRNSMLHWDINDRYAPEDYMVENNDGKMELKYEPIKNDSMNQKMSVWFKFFKYQASRKEPMSMSLSTRMIEVSIKDVELQHLRGVKSGMNTMLVERWDLMVPPSPPRLYFNVISEVEYEAFKTQLLKIDPVYAAMADLAVSTGLRKDAILNVEPTFFKNTLKEINQGGKELETGFRPMHYENKGGRIEIVDVPLAVIHEINHVYLSAFREDRKNRHAINYGTDLHYMWFREDGKKVESHDLDAAFREASLAMNRSIGIDNIKPHTLRHAFATWAVIRGAKQLGVNLLTLNSSEVPKLIHWVQLQLAHVSEQTTKIYIVTAILMLTPKRSGPVIQSHMINRGEVLKDLLEADAKLYFGEDYDGKKFDALEWAKFKRYDMESAVIDSLKKDCRKK